MNVKDYEKFKNLSTGEVKQFEIELAERKRRDFPVKAEKDSLIDFFQAIEDEELNFSARSVYGISDLKHRGFQMSFHGIDFETIENSGTDEYDEDDVAIWFVFKTTENGEEKFWKFSGWRSSYDGPKYDTLKQVTGKEKTITVWE